MTNRRRSVQYYIEFEPETRGVPVAVFYAIDGLVVHGYYWGYAGGGSYSEHYFRMGLASDPLAAASFWICDNAEDRVFFSDLHSGSHAPRPMSAEDARVLQAVSEVRGEWLEWDWDADVVVVAADRVPAGPHRRERLVRRSCGLDFGLLALMSEHWALHIGWTIRPPADDDRSPGGP